MEEKVVDLATISVGDILGWTGSPKWRTKVIGVDNNGIVHAPFVSTQGTPVEEMEEQFYEKRSYGSITSRVGFIMIEKAKLDPVQPSVPPIDYKRMM